MNDMSRRDLLGTSVADYSRKFMGGIGEPQAMAFAPEAGAPRRGVGNGCGAAAIC